MTKREVIKRLCKIVTTVGSHLKHTVEHDCICGENPLAKDRTVVGERVLVFIEEAVAWKIRSEAPENPKVSDERCYLHRESAEIYPIEER